MEPVASLSGVVLEARDHEELARFYSGLTGLPVVFVDEDVVSIGGRANADFHLSSQRAPDHEPPRWPGSRTLPDTPSVSCRRGDAGWMSRGIISKVTHSAADQPYGVRDCAFRDPAGNLIRIQELR